MNKRVYVNAILVTLSHVAIFMVLAHYFDSIFDDYKLYLIIGGLLLFLLSGAITRLILKKESKHFEGLIISLSYIILFLGVNTYIKQFTVATYMPFILIAGVALFIWHDWLTEKVMQ